MSSMELHLTLTLTAPQMLIVIPLRPKEDLYLDFDMIERWLVMKCPLFESIYLFVLAQTFGMALFSTAGYASCVIAESCSPLLYYYQARESSCEI